MRYVTRALLLAVVMSVAGCSLFRDSAVQVAKLTVVVVPDTVRVDSEFHATLVATLGPTSAYEFERFEVSSSGAELTVQAWSRFRPDIVDPIRLPGWQDFVVGAIPAEPGAFRIVAIQPDKRETLKTITVLP